MRKKNYPRGKVAAQISRRSIPVQEIDLEGAVVEDMTITHLEVETINVGDNIRYEAAAVEEAEDMFLRIGFNGLTSLYKAPDQDDHWEDTDTTAFAITGSAQVITAVVPDQDVLTTDGSYNFGCQLDNTANKDTNVTITAVVDGTDINSEVFSIGKSEIGKFVLLSGGIASNISSGVIVSITLEANNTGVLARGDLSATKFELTKAATPVIVTTFNNITTGESTIPAIVKSAESLSGFDRQKMHEGGKNLGVMEFCQSASSGIFWRIDYNGDTSKHTSQTTFGEGTTLADRTVVQYKVSGETDFEYWYQGDFVKFATTKSLQLDADAAKYVYYDVDGNLSVAAASDRELIVKETLIAYITDSTTFGGDPYFADERHGIDMSGRTHLRLHRVDGFRVITHGDITGIANNNDTFTSVSAGSCTDEDIAKILAEITTAPKMYKIGANWGVSDDDNKLALLDGGVTQVNTITAGSGALVDLTGNDRMGMVMVACNDSINPIRILVGQTAYADRGEARDHVPAEWERVEKAGLPSPEITSYFTFIIDPNGNIETGADGEIYVMNKNDVLIPMF